MRRRQMRPDLPSPALLAQQAEWLAPARARLLRCIGIARRGRVLDLGAGYGVVTAELARRAGGPVVALDRAIVALHTISAVNGVQRVGGNAVGLPFASHTFDVVFSQLTLVWLAPLDIALAEIARLLVPGGVLVALEPDYAGMIEHPATIATRELWSAGLQRAGATPNIGRVLPAKLAAQGLDVRVSLLDTLISPHPTRFELLRGLPLTEKELMCLHDIETTAANLTEPWQQIAHLPFFLITATKSEI